MLISSARLPVIHALFPGGSPQTPVLASLDGRPSAVLKRAKRERGVWGLARKKAPGRYIQDIATSRHRYSQVLL